MWQQQEHKVGPPYHFDESTKNKTYGNPITRWMASIQDSARATAATTLKEHLEADEVCCPPNRSPTLVAVL